MPNESIAKLNLNTFIATERQICTSAFPKILWESNSWSISDLDPSYRGQPFQLTFNVHSMPIQKDNVVQPEKHTPLPTPYREFCKAFVIHIRRSRGVKARSINAHLIEAKRLYNVMYFRGESSPTKLKIYHFQYLEDYLAEIDYVQLYDATTTLTKIAELIDRFDISIDGTGYKSSVRPNRQHLRVRYEDEEPSGKEFSREAIEAYAAATNAPINNGEEILLRTIDLLIAMGQRGNEVTHIPLDCWVEQVEKNEKGVIQNDGNGKAIKTYGIRYYAEKHAVDRVHYLADPDVPLAKRAVERLTILCEKARAVARFQRQNPNRIWDVDPDIIMTYTHIHKHLSFATNDGLQKFLSRIGVKPTFNGRYRAGDIETALLKHKRLSKVISNHAALSDESGKVVLYKHELLSLGFDGQFRMKRANNQISVVVDKISTIQLNKALGASPIDESIFDRRGLTEADGSRITITTHLPRHWRNTLYEMGGMSEVQQALATGRVKVSQNRAYQHASIQSKNSLLHDFIHARDPGKRLDLFKKSVREGLVEGNIVTAYNKIKMESLIDAETFLNEQVMAVHVTPYGACSHDFSKAPCPKHLQCFNSCSHLHRTNNPDETKQLEALITAQRKNIERMKSCGDSEAGADVWIETEIQKLHGMEAALRVNIPAVPIRIFPNGHKVNGPRKSSAV